MAFLDVLGVAARRAVGLWNWKSAALSACTRATIFCLVNLQAGPGAGLHAFAVEFVLRGTTAGFYGAITQALSGVRPVWAASVAALTMLPALGHAAELLVHGLAGTARLGPSIVASVLFTLITTSFNLFAMRRGVLVVGPRSRPLTEDLRALPGTVFDFLAAVPRSVVTLMRARET